MSESEYLLSQADIFKDLLEGTIQGCASGKRLKHTEIVAGANATIMTFRNFGEGFALDCTDSLDSLSNPAFEPYHLEPLAGLHSFELLCFRDGIKTLIRYKKGILSRWETEPSATPDGLLFRLGWDGVLEGEVMLTAGGVQEIAKEVGSQYALERVPDIWFNGERISPLCEWRETMITI